MKKTFSILNTIIGAVWLILFVMIGLKSNIIGLILFLAMTVLHLGAGIGTISGQDWGSLVTKILAWFGTIFYGLITLITIVTGARAMVRVLAYLPMFRGQAAGGFIAGFSVIIILFLPFIAYYLIQIQLSNKTA